MANGTWRIARGRNGAHLPLAIVAVLAIVLILLGKAQSSIFDRARTSLTDWMRPALETVSAPFAGIAHWVGGLGGIFSVYEDNLKLKQQNARLMQWRNRAIVLEARLARYNKLLHAVPDPALSWRMAHVIGHASQPFEQTMILDAGKAEGIKPGQAVIDARGMVGRIFLTGEHTSWVLLLTDLNSRIPVMIEPSHAHAIMAGDNELAPVIETLSQGVKLKDGDQVVTSGDGGLLPPGLAIGTVVSHGEEFRVVLLADPANAEDVNIVDYQRPIENPPPVAPGDLPAVSAGLPPAVPQPSVPAATPPGPTPAPALAPGTGATPAKPGTRPAVDPQGTDDNEDH